MWCVGTLQCLGTPKRRCDAGQCQALGSRKAFTRRMVRLQSDMPYPIFILFSDVQHSTLFHFTSPPMLLVARSRFSTLGVPAHSCSDFEHPGVDVSAAAVWHVHEWLSTVTHSSLAVFFYGCCHGCC